MLTFNSIRAGTLSHNFNQAHAAELPPGEEDWEEEWTQCWDDISGKELDQGEVKKARREGSGPLETSVP